MPCRIAREAGRGGVCRRRSAHYLHAALPSCDPVGIPRIRCCMCVPTRTDGQMDIHEDLCVHCTLTSFPSAKLTDVFSRALNHVAYEIRPIEVDLTAALMREAPMASCILTWRRGKYLRIVCYADLCGSCAGPASSRLRPARNAPATPGTNRAPYAAA